MSSQDSGSPWQPPVDPSPDPALGVYGITVTAELTGVAVQTLRLYERRGLLQPARTQGGTRRYSRQDLNRLGRIAELVQAGINLPGIARILDLEHSIAGLQADKTELHQPDPSRRPRTDPERDRPASAP